MIFFKQKIKKYYIFFLSCIFILLGRGTYAVSDLFKNSLLKTKNAAGYGPISTSEGDLIARVGNIIGIALSFLGVIFLILTIYAGFNWMIARGDQSKITKAKDTLIASVSGLIVVVAAYAISYFVVQYLSIAALPK